jgi:hypothetical protein
VSKVTRPDARPVQALCPETGRVLATIVSVYTLKRLGHNPGDVWMCCEGIRKTHHKLRWRRLPARSVLTQQPERRAA